MATDINPKHQYFLKVDMEFFSADKLMVYINHNYHAGVDVEKWNLHMESKADTEGGCIEKVFDFAESLRDALTKLIDERERQNAGQA